MTIARVGVEFSWGDTTPTLVSGTHTPNGSGNVAIIGILHTGTANVPDATSLAGTSLSNIQKIITLGYATNAAPTHKVEIYSALTTGTPGALTWTIGGTCDGMKATLAEFTGIDSAQGTNGVITTNTATGFSNANSTALLATLGAAGNVANGAYMIAANNNQSDFTTGAGWTRISGNSYNTPSAEEATYWSAVNITAAAATGLATGVWGVAAVELAGVVASTNTTLPGQFSTRDL